MIRLVIIDDSDAGIYSRLSKQHYSHLRFS